MHSFNLDAEQAFDPRRHVEKILGVQAGGDYTVACWEPGQASPHHCHPDATEIYFCFTGGGVMRSEAGAVAIVPGSFCVHPPGELHEFVNGPVRSLLFRIRYGQDLAARILEWSTNPGWAPMPEDTAYFSALLADAR